MPIRDFAELKAAALGCGKMTVAVAGAADAEIIKLTSMLRSEGLGDAILVGDKKIITKLCAEEGLNDVRTVAASSDEEAAALAVKLVHDGEADVLMKGLMNTSVYLHAVLDKTNGLRTGRLLCHFAAFEIPGQNRLHFHSDTAMCPAPDLEQKKQIIISCTEALHRLGYEEPKVAVLAANEKVDPRVQAGVDAAELQRFNEAGEVTGCLVEGPVAMDVALSREVAAHKHIESRVSGEADLFIFPDIHSGNITGKVLTCVAGAKTAGVVLGAAAPIVLVSRAENAEAKFNALLLSCALNR